jgi:DNA-nicking Smr family endonuclease
MGKKRLSGGSGEPAGSVDELFRAAVSDVKPLPPVPVIPGLEKPKPRRIRRTPSVAEPIDELMPLVEPDAEVGAEQLSFQRAGLRPQVMRRLRRGLYPVEDELDLHGMTQTAARDALGDFLAGSRDAGHRCVRIIHGKGYRSGARGPVLKTAVNLWLRRHMDVMAFTSARTIDGGTGALYVLLRG